VLGCPLADVPELYDPDSADGRPDDRVDALWAWLKARGIIPVYVTAPERRPLPIDWSAVPDHIKSIGFDRYYLIGGHNPDGVPHYVVGFDAVPVWDTNPSRRGIISWDGFLVLMPIEEAMLRIGKMVENWPAIIVKWEVE
jgi:hypothetical protein